MITVLAVTVVFACAIVALLYQNRQHATQLERANEAWTAERRELLNRVQAPHIIPHAQQHVETPELPADDWHLVGTIHNDPELYLRADESVNGNGD